MALSLKVPASHSLHPAPEAAAQQREQIKTTLSTPALCLWSG